MLRRPAPPTHASTPSAPEALAFLETQYGVVHRDDVGGILAQLRAICEGPVLEPELRARWAEATSLALCGDAHSAQAMAGGR